jgi:hypothetical protein
MKPSIYILRKSHDPLPGRDVIRHGDIVIMASGDILVSVNEMWEILPGRYIDVNELKEFVSYVSSGWPESPETARADLEGRLPEQFLSRMLETVEKLVVPGKI